MEVLGSCRPQWSSVQGSHRRVHSLPDSQGLKGPCALRDDLTMGSHLLLDSPLCG